MNYHYYYYCSLYSDELLLCFSREPYFCCDRRCEEWQIPGQIYLRGRRKSADRRLVLPSSRVSSPRQCDITSWPHTGVLLTGFCATHSYVGTFALHNLLGIVRFDRVFVFGTTAKRDNVKSHLQTYSNTMIQALSLPLPPLSPPPFPSSSFSRSLALTLWISFFFVNT